MKSDKRFPISCAFIQNKVGRKFFFCSHILYAKSIWNNVRSVHNPFRFSSNAPKYERKEGEDPNQISSSQPPPPRINITYVHVSCLSIWTWNRIFGDTCKLDISQLYDAVLDASVAIFLIKSYLFLLNLYLLDIFAKIYVKRLYK